MRELIPRRRRPSKFDEIQIDTDYSGVDGITLVDSARLDELIQTQLEEISRNVDAFASEVDKIQYNVQFKRVSHDFYSLKCALKVGIGPQLTLNFVGFSRSPQIAFEKALAKMKVTIGNDWKSSDELPDQFSDFDLKWAG